MDTNFDPFLKRDIHKLTTIYATTFSCDFKLDFISITENEYFNFGRLSRFYKTNSNQFPKIIGSLNLEEPEIESKRLGNKSKVKNIEIHLFVLPSNQVLISFTISFNLKIKDAILLMEDFYYRDFTVDNKDSIELVEILGGKNLDYHGDGFDETYHQIFTANKKHIPKDLDDNLIQKIIYRADLPYRKDYNSIKYPLELNRRPNTYCGMGQFVTCIGGHQGYMEDCIHISALIVTASVSRLRIIKKEATNLLETIKSENEEKNVSLKQRRRVLNKSVSKLSELQLNLSLFVEAPSHLGMLVPALRLESYHDCLVEANKVSKRSSTIRSIISQIERICVLRRSRITNIEREADEAHRSMWAVIISLLSALSIPPAIIFSFFGAEIAEMPKGTSLFDFSQFGYLYITVLLSILMAFLIGLVTWYFLKPKKNMKRML